MQNNTRFALCFAFALTLTGCALFSLGNTPENKYLTANDTFAAAVTVAIQLKQAGKIDQERWDEVVLPAINAGNELLREMKLALDEGREFDKPRAALAAIVVGLAGRD